MPAPQVPRAAATVMLVRQAAQGLDVYLTRRSGRSRFMPDAYVFPGGTLEAADGSPAMLARLLGEPAGIAPAFAVAALRELFEEAGVLIAASRDGRPAVPAPERLTAMRAALAAKTPFADVLAEDDLRLDVRELVHYSNWITPESEPLRFDTHFFLATAPAGQTAEADAIEVHDGRWFAPADALERAARGELNVQFPTRRHLERLAAHDSIKALFAAARGRRIIPVTPIRTSRETDPVLVPGTEHW